MENKVDSNHINGVGKSRWDYRYSRRLHEATQLYLVMILLQSFMVLHLSTIEVWPDGRRKITPSAVQTLLKMPSLMSKVSEDLSPR